MSRTNNARRKLTVYLSEADRENARYIMAALPLATEAAALRHALKFTAKTYREPSAMRLLLREFADFAGRLELASPATVRRAGELKWKADQLCPEIKQ